MSYFPEPINVNTKRYAAMSGPNDGFRSFRVTPEYLAEKAAVDAERARRGAQSKASHGRLVNLGKAATIAAGGMAFAPGGAVSLGGAAGGASLPAAATEGIGFSSAGTGAGMGIPWWNIASKGVDTLFGIYSNRQASKANKEATAYQVTANEQAMQMEREQLAEQRRQWEAMQQFESQKWAASEEERLYDRRLRDEREARLAPRRAMAADALQRIPGILAGGRTSPGLASLGSYRRP